MKIEVYSAICGGFDRVRSDEVLCFSAYDRFTNPRLNAKIYKVLSHKFVDADYSIWIDGNIRLNVAPEKLVDMMGQADCALFRHCERDNIYDEGAAIIRLGKDIPARVNEQLDAYRALGWEKKDLGQCGVLVRRNTAQVARRNEQWWAEICRYSVRDQLSFPVVFDGVAHYFDAVPMTQNKFWSRTPHGRVR